jgi:glycosyltransferase involved in cell wall biosynthesis
VVGELGLEDLRPELASVVIPARNAEHVISRAIESLLAQTYAGPWELIVVDNGSSDSTFEVARRALEASPPRALVRAEILQYSERFGYASPRNFGARQALGELLLFCDADDQVVPEWLSAMVDAEPASLRSSVQVPLDEPPSRSETLGLASGSLDPPVKFGVPVAHTGGMGCSRELFEQLGGFDPHFDQGGEDVDFSIRARLVAGVHPVVVADARYLVSGRTSSVTGFRQGYRNGRSQVRLFARHRSALLVEESKPRASVRRIRILLRRSPWLFSPTKRAAWVQIAGVTSARFVWSIRLGVNCF